MGDFNFGLTSGLSEGRSVLKQGSQRARSCRCHENVDLWSAWRVTTVAVVKHLLVVVAAVLVSSTAIPVASEITHRLDLQ